MNRVNSTAPVEPTGDSTFVPYDHAYNQYLNGNSPSANAPCVSGAGWTFAGLELAEVEVESEGRDENGNKRVILGAEKRYVNDDNSSKWFTIILPCGRRFFALKSMLKNVTHYFDAIFKGTYNWQETATGIVHLSNCDVSTFLVFAQWINTGYVGDLSSITDAIVMPNSGESLDGKRLGMYAKRDWIHNQAFNPTFDLLFDAWQLGDYFICPTFQNAVMNEILKWYSTAGDTIPLYNLRYIFDNKPESSPLRRVLLDSVRFGIDTEVFRDAMKMNAIPMELIKELVVLSKTREELDRSSGWFSYPCDYHVRPAGSEVCPCPEFSRLSSVDDSYDGNGKLW